jgi:hypothetical protein
MRNSLLIQDNDCIINEENPTLTELKKFAFRSIQQFDVSDGTKRDYLYGLAAFYCKSIQ